MQYNVYMKEYYVYKHIRLDTNTVFYIGKGSAKRAWSTSNRNKYWNNIVKKCGYRVEIIEYFSTNEDEAFEKEKELIALNKSLGYCEANILDGGQGGSGLRHSDQTKLILSEINKGNKNALGSVRSKETKCKLSKAHIGKTLTKDHKKKISKASAGENNGFYGKKHSLASRVKAGHNRTKPQRFNAWKADKADRFNPKKGELIGTWWFLSDCAKELQIHRSGIGECLNNRSKSHKGYIFEYEEVTEDKPVPWNKNKTMTKDCNLKNAITQGATCFSVYKAIGKRGNWSKGEFVGEWISRAQCCKDLGFSLNNKGKPRSNAITDCLHGRSKYYKGYIFEYSIN